ncbi:hypothetical protein [Amycolatopsis sp. cmx-11-51]|uniref:hypothetical protein n=1 Tax=Amycolatopsis sp. cmx-11-51 TaxID=2785797 RepID=UPI0039E5FCE5
MGLAGGIIWVDKKLHRLFKGKVSLVALAGKEIPVKARELLGDEYDAMWKLLLDFWPGYSTEERSARRVLPIFELKTPAR